MFKDTKLRVIKFPAFWQSENAISADSWNQRFKVPRKDGGNFINFWVSKMRFSRVVKSTIKWYQASYKQIFHVLVVWNFDFCRFVKPTFHVPREDCKKFSSLLRPKNAILPIREIHVSRLPSSVSGNVAQRVGIFYMFETWKCDFAQSWNQRFKGTKFRGSKFPQVPRFVWTNYPHFVCLKMRFLPIREIKVSRKEGDILIIFFIILIFPRWEIHVSSLAWLRFVLLCLVWLCLAWFGLAWLGLSWLGLAWLGLAWLS